MTNDIYSPQTMNLVERHIINKNHKFYIECDDLCWKSKNLYNSTLYITRQHFCSTGEYISCGDLYHKAKHLNEYKELPAKISQQTIRMLDKNFKSFFRLIKKKSVKIKKRPPRYLDKIKGRCITIYNKQAISKLYFKKTGHLKLSKTKILINTQITDFNIIKQVRIVPKINHYVIEVVYTKELDVLIQSNIIASIDPGLNNLATVAFNDMSITPFIINGRPLKSINQYYNKKKSKLTSKIKKENNKYTSNAIQKLTNKRNRKVQDYLHKASHLLVNQLVSSRVSKLVIGKNIGQKQDINIGKKNNQNFTCLPICNFLDMVSYKATLKGITVIFHEESYTSKASFIDGDVIPTYGDTNIPKFSGRRIKRGLYKTNQGKIINADLNGALNILKKAIPNGFNPDSIEGFVVSPMRLNILTA